MNSYILIATILLFAFAESRFVPQASVINAERTQMSLDTIDEDSESRINQPKFIDNEGLVENEMYSTAQKVHILLGIILGSFVACLIAISFCLGIWKICVVGQKALSMSAFYRPYFETVSVEAKDEVFI